ncbi:MAG: apolipoprotein N-acyltransferase [Treponema sp.]|nr:apolipoprotein N-acyltransferase [Treponema sp.]
MESAGAKDRKVIFVIRIARNRKSGVKTALKNVAIALAYIAMGVALFGLSQPSVVFVRGLPFLAYAAYIPVFLLVRRVSWKTVWLCGLIYGIASYCFFTYWLAAFHPLGIFVISFMYGLYLMLVFPLLKAAVVWFPKKGWLVQWLMWVAYEYAKTLGFAGFHYGVTAYSHWRWTHLIQIADLTGVWGVSALIVFVSAWFSAVIHDRSVKAHKISACLWLACFAFTVIYGFVGSVDYSKDKTVEVALIQQNSDPWVGGMTAYRRDLVTLQRLSDEALASSLDIELVVWPETAFVPRIAWHYQRREEHDKFELVESLLAYLDSAPVRFIIGNDHAEEGYIEDRRGVVDYNATVLFSPGQNVIPPRPEVYKKMHLVPFTEYFPYSRQFPKLYEMLLNGDTHMWEPGKELHVFSVGELHFGTPVCFEDTFGYIGRRFVNNGANALVNLSNDAWSKSLACQYQHLSMAVFRTVENRIPEIRATASGQTAIIDPNGKVTAMAEPFRETWLTGKIPIRDMTKKTLYTCWGDYMGVLYIILAAAALLWGMILAVRVKYGGRKED